MPLRVCLFTTSSPDPAAGGGSTPAAAGFVHRVLLVEDGRITLDLPVPLARPRQRGDAAFATLERRLLERLLRTDTSKG